MLGALLLFVLTIATWCMAADIWAWATEASLPRDVWLSIAIMAAVPWLGDLGIRMLMGRANGPHLIPRMAPRSLIRGGAMMVAVSIWATVWRADVNDIETARVSAVGVAGGFIAIIVGLIRQRIASRNAEPRIEPRNRTSRGYGHGFGHAPRYRVSFRRRPR